MDAGSNEGLFHNCSGFDENLVVHFEEFTQDDNKKSETCPNYDDHFNYIPVKDFTLGHLPIEIQNPETLEAIGIRGELTVRIRTSRISIDRPSSDETENKEVIKEGFATGIITSITTGVDRPIHSDCICQICTETNEPKKEWWELIVSTAYHVIRDKTGAKSALFDCFYDDETKSDMKTIYGSDIHYSITRIDTMGESDLCEVICVTHDEEIVKRIAKVFTRIEQNPKLAKQPSEVIVSHPHGWSKRISRGIVFYLTVPINPEFEVGKPISLMNHTKCRLQPLEKKNTDDSNIERLGEQKPKRLEKSEKEPQTRASSMGDENDKKSTTDDGATARSQGDDNHSTDNILTSGRETDCSILELFSMEGFKDYVSIYLLLAMEGWLAALDFMIDSKNKKGNYSGEDITNVNKFVSTLKPKIQSLKEGNPDLFRTKQIESFSSIIKKYKEFNMLQNELFNIFFPQIDDLIFSYASVYGTHNRPDYKDDFSLIISLYDKVFENIHPEHEIIDHYINNSFNDLMHLSICYIRRAMFSSLKKCPTDFNIAYKKHGSEFTIPAGVTFTLPENAKYAFRYKNGKPDWFKFPPGTQFAHNGKSFPLPDGAEFHNETLYPKHCFVTHNILACGGSSGAAVYCHLLDMPFMTLFPHRSQLDTTTVSDDLIDGERYSGTQTNQFCTLLAKISKTIEDIQVPKEEIEKKKLL